jgi:hypothetical protein
LSFQIAALPPDRIELHPTEAGLERILTVNILGDKASRDIEAPQVFLVDMVDPNSRIKPHFHGVDQFQLVVRGSGSLGKNAVRTGSFHYADAWQPYGPLTAGDEGLAYLTIRARHDSGAHYMPGGGRHREGKPRRPHFVEPVDVSSPETRTIVGPTDDRLRVARVWIEIGEQATFTADPDSGGEIGVVLAGSLRHEGGVYGQWSCFSLAPGQRCQLEAGSDGADVLELQFPLTSGTRDA